MIYSYKRENKKNLNEIIKKNNNKMRKESNYKEKNRKYINKKKHGNIVVIIKLLTMINLIIQILSINKIYLIEYKYSNVTLKIKGTGTKKVYSTSYLKVFPKEVFINGKKQDEAKNNYNFEDIQSTVKLVWYNNIHYGAVVFGYYS